MNKLEAIEKLKEGIQKYSPVVAEFFENENKIVDYSKSLYDYQVGDIYLKRQKFLVNAIEDYIKNIFNFNINIDLPFITNIVDHHTILNHPILIATNIVANAHKLFTHSQPVVVLTSSVIPPNNFFNKNGILFHNKRIPFYSNKEMHQSICFMSPRNFNIIEKLTNIKRLKDFDSEEISFLTEIEIRIKGLGIEEFNNHPDQISILDNYLWKQLYHKDCRNNLNKLFYVPQEKIICSIFEKVLKDSDNLVSRSLFDKKFQISVLKNFNNITGCWNLKMNKGTHFFWHKKNNNEIESLVIKNNFLVNKKNDYKVELNPNNLIEHILLGNIIPNLFIIFAYIIFWCNVRPLVGHGSSNYLTNMKNAWQKVLKDFDQEENLNLSKIDTKGLIGGAVATYKRSLKGDLESQYTFDVIASGGLTSEYINNLINMKFIDLLNPALLEIYESYVPANERVNLGLNTNDMIGSEFDWLN